MSLSAELEAQITDTKYWFVREAAGEPLSGPYTYAHANEVARDLSEDEYSLKTAEIVIYVGTRPGDPAMAPKERVVAYYELGIQKYKGRTAEWKNDLP